jgi:hypothetical protein
MRTHGVANQAAPWDSDERGRASNNAASVRANSCKARDCLRIFFHPDCDRRPWHRTRSADPARRGRWPNRAGARGLAGARRLTAGGEFHPALKTHLWFEPAIWPARKSIHEASAGCSEAPRRIGATGRSAFARGPSCCEVPSPVASPCRITLSHHPVQRTGSGCGPMLACEPHVRLPLTTRIAAPHVSGAPDARLSGRGRRRRSSATARPARRSRPPTAARRASLHASARGRQAKRRPHCPR